MESVGINNKVDKEVIDSLSTNEDELYEYTLIIRNKETLIDVWSDKIMASSYSDAHARWEITFPKLKDEYSGGSFKLIIFKGQ